MELDSYLLGLAVGGLGGIIVAIIMCIKPPVCDCACCVGCEECDCFCDECDCDCRCPDCEYEPPGNNHVTINVGPVSELKE